MTKPLSSYNIFEERNAAILRRLAGNTGGLGYLAAKDAVDPGCVKEREKERDKERDKRTAKRRAQRGLTSA